MAPSKSKSKLLLKRYYCNNTEVCGYSEEINAPTSSLKVCVRCDLVKYCSEDCEIEKRPEHHVVCKERRNHLRQINDLKKDLNVVYNFRFRQNVRATSGSDYIATLKKLEKVTYEMAEEKVDYHLFEKAYEFFRLSIEYCRPEQGSEMLETIAKTLGYQLILNYEEYGEGKHGVYYNIPLNILLPRIESQDGLEIAKFAPEIRALVSRIKQMNIPELCDYMNSYETFVSVLRYSSRDSVYYRVYCKDNPLQKIKQFLEIEMEKDCKAFVDENLEFHKATMNDLGIHRNRNVHRYVWEDLLLWEFPYFMGCPIAKKAFSAFLHQHPQIHRYLKILFFELKAVQEAEFEDSG